MSVSFYLIKDRTILAPEGFDPAGDDDNPLSLNVANTNARMLFDLVGIRVGQDMTGEIENVGTLEHTCQQILHALRADPALDAGRKSVEHRSQSGALFIDCAPADGYLLDRITRLRQLAEEALLRDAELVYG